MAEEPLKMFDFTITVEDTRKEKRSVKILEVLEF